MKSKQSNSQFKKIVDTNSIFHNENQMNIELIEEIDTAKKMFGNLKSSNVLSMQHSNSNSEKENNFKNKYLMKSISITKLKDYKNNNLTSLNQMSMIDDVNFLLNKNENSKYPNLSINNSKRISNQSENLIIESIQDNNDIQDGELLNLQETTSKKISKEYTEEKNEVISNSQNYKNLLKKHQKLNSLLVQNKGQKIDYNQNYPVQNQKKQSQTINDTTNLSKNVLPTSPNFSICKDTRKIGKFLFKNNEDFNSYPKNPLKTLNHSSTDASILNKYNDEFCVGLKPNSKFISKLGVIGKESKNSIFYKDLFTEEFVQKSQIPKQLNKCMSINNSSKSLFSLSKDHSKSSKSVYQNQRHLNKSKLIETKEDNKINRLNNLYKFHKNISLSNLKNIDHDEYVNLGNANSHPEVRQILTKEKNVKNLNKSIKVKQNIIDQTNEKITKNEKNVIQKVKNFNRKILNEKYDFFQKLISRFILERQKLNLQENYQRRYKKQQRIKIPSKKSSQNEFNY